jgi:tetratricopeptide (TPR) repeat protein
MSPSAQTLGDMASLLIQTDRAQDALTILRGNGEIVREVPILHALRGRSLVALKSHDLAARAFARAVERCETFEQMSAVSGQMAQAIGIDDAISQLEGLQQQSQAALIEMGIVRLEVEHDRNDAAMERLRRVDALVPESSDLRAAYNHYLALVLYKQKAFEQALVIYKKILKVQPNNVMTLNNTAYMLAQDMDRAAEAVPLAQHAAEIAPNNAVVLDTYGWSMHKAGQVDAALEILRRSVRLSPSGLNCLHLAEAQIQRGDSQSAIEMLNKSMVLAEESNDERTQWLAKKRLDELNRYPGP